MMDRDEVRELLADITDPMLDTFEQMGDFLHAMPEGAERDKIFRRTAAVMERLKKGLPILSQQIDKDGNLDPNFDALWRLEVNAAFDLFRQDG
jgi:hypothetical protein